MATREAKPDRLTAFSDGVFAVVITILVLEMKPPQASSFESLVSLWPTWVSYAVSYWEFSRPPRSSRSDIRRQVWR